MSTTSLFAFGISFAIYTLIVVAVGLYSARFAKRSDEDYLLAGRSLGKWVAALSASASSESGWVTLGLVGWAFTEGVRAYWIIPGCLVGFLFNWFVLAGPLHDRSRALNCLTLPDFFSLHFRERLPILRLLSVLIIFVSMMLYVAAQFAAAGKAFSAAFPDVSYAVGVLIGATIVLIYTVSGGFRAVCWTDFLQGLLMIAALVGFPLFLLLQQGGFASTFAGLESLGPDYLRFVPQMAPAAFLGFILGSGALGINFGYPGQPHVLARFMSLKSRKEALAGGIISVIWATSVYFGAVTIGLFSRAAANSGVDWARVMLEKPDIYGELGLVLSAVNLLPGILSGLVLAAVLAAICSTADSQIMVAGSVVSHDVYTTLIDKRTRTSHLLFNRFSVLVLGLLAVMLVISEEVRVYKYVLTYGWAFLGASFGPQIILALFWKRATYAGCIAGMLTGFVTAIAWPNLYSVQATGIEVYNLPLAFLLALIVNGIVSLSARDR